MFASDYHNCTPDIKGLFRTNALISRLIYQHDQNMRGSVFSWHSSTARLQSRGNISITAQTV